MSCGHFDFEITPDSAEQEKIEAIAMHYREIIKLIGENPEREGLVKTPMRAAKAMWFATQGYRQDPKEILRQAVFEYAGSQMVAQGKHTLGTNPRSSYHSCGVRRKFSHRYFTIDGLSMSRMAPPML